MKHLPGGANSPITQQDSPNADSGTRNGKQMLVLSAHPGADPLAKKN